MDNTIVEYLAEARSSFADEPLNDVDSLILTTVAYFSFEHGTLGNVVPSDIVPLPVAVCGIAQDELFGGIWLAGMGGGEFLAALLASPRFMGLNVGYYINEVSGHFEKQFSAITFYLPGGAVYVSFRGTDNSLAGWKEDFNLTFMEEVPSQVSARTYLEDRAQACEGALYVGGHSKGGNLAEYAALTCREATFAKIERVFNHDGPGFAFTPSERISSDEYRAKLSKTVPESSVFGMLMESRADYRVVRASGVLFMQHASTHWAVEDGDFIDAKKVSPEASLLTDTLNGWAQRYEPGERERFIDAVYDLFCAAGADTWSQFARDRTSNALAVAAAAAKLPADVRANIAGMLRDIAPIFGSEAAERLRDLVPGTQDK